MENFQQTPPTIPARNREPSFVEIPQSTPQTSMAEGVAVDLATVLANTLQGLLRNTAADIRTPLQTFSGLEQEDPRTFIARLREHFVKTRTESDQERVLIATKQLRGDASRWFSPYAAYPITFEELEFKLLSRYDGPSARAVLKSKLYGDRQRDGESASLFIIKKRTLFNRVDPSVSEEAMIAIVTELLTPKLKAYLRGHSFQTLEDLTRVTEQIEADFGETTSTLTSPSNATGRYQPPQQRTIPTNNVTNSSSRATPRQNEVVTRTDSTRDAARTNTSTNRA